MSKVKAMQTFTKQIYPINICFTQSRFSMHSIGISVLPVSMRILGLREGATEGEVKAAYQAMSRIYHPDKHNSGFTGMSDEEAVEFFQHLNNAHSYLREIM